MEDKNTQVGLSERIKHKPSSFGYWNVTTLHRPGALHTLLEVLDQYKICITAIQEINWIGQGLIRRRKHTIYYSCDDDSHILGTGFVVAGRYRGSVMDFKPVSPRLCSIRIKGKFLNYTMMSCHAPTEASEAQYKDEFYDSLERTIRACPDADIKIIAGDFGAEVGKETMYAKTVGKHSLHEISNDNGVRLIKFCASQNLVIGSTLFPHKKIHKGTWYSPDGLIVNQIDHLLISAEKKFILNDVRTFRGASFASDHYLATAKINFIISSVKNKKGQRDKKFDTTKLGSQSETGNYIMNIVERRNSLSMLGSNILQN